MGLEGARAAVWGDGAGVGDAIAAALAGAGAEVWRAGATLEGLDRSNGGGAARDGVTELCKRVADGGGLDVAVICTDGPVDAGPLAALSDAAWEAELDRGLGLAFRGVRAALAAMLPRGAGRVIVTAAAESKLPRPGDAAYAAGQHGIAGLVKSAAHEVGREGIAVNAIIAGPRNADDVDLLERSALKRPTAPAEIAAAAALLADPECASLTGTLFPVHGGAIQY